MQRSPAGRLSLRGGLQQDVSLYAAVSGRTSFFMQRSPAGRLSLSGRTSFFSTAVVETSDLMFFDNRAERSISLLGGHQKHVVDENRG